MFKKLSFLFVTLLTLLPIRAQQTVGDWYVHPLFAETISDMADTGDLVYYKSGTRLFSYDKKSGETYCYTSSNKLSDVNVSGIYYNPDKGYLVVTYDTGNIDLLYDNGKVVNMPDIKNANLTTSKTINDVDFGNDRIAVATAFGIVIFSDTRHEVEQSSIFNFSVPLVGIAGDIIVFYYNNYVYMGYATTHLNNLDKYTRNTNTAINLTRMVGIDKSNLLCQLGDGTKQMVIITAYPDLGLIGVDGRTVVPTSAFRRYSDGFYATSASELYVVSKDGATVTTTAIPTALQDNQAAMSGSLKSVWFGNSDGITNYDLSSSTPTMLQDRTKPQASVTKEAVFFAKSADGSKIYVSNPGASRRGSVGSGLSPNSYYYIKQRTTLIEDGDMSDASLMSATGGINSTFVNSQKSQSWPGIIAGSQSIDVDPANPDRYVVANYFEGVFIVENGKQVALFNSSNAKMKNAWSNGVGSARYDAQGNLWMLVWTVFDSDTRSFTMLPAAKLKGDISAITASDWQDTKLSDLYGGDLDMDMLVCRKSNMIFVWDLLNACYYAYDTKGTTDTSDDVVLQVSTFTDQDGKAFTPNTIYCMTEDDKGRVWVGTNSGIFEITDPSQATDPSMRINHIKVPRNDGTNYADYLLDSEPVYGISCDGLNRKWIATDGSGIYLVSEDGDNIIEQFDMDNSPIPTNTVQSVCCDPMSNRVYFGFASGIMSYNSTSAPAAEDYSDVYAYPNPVRPDFTGYITVTGLMEDSLVKIADAAGNVFHSGRSEGGMFVWDGCNAAGDRVKSGVYFVYASQGSDTSTSAVVTKILVIN